MEKESEKVFSLTETQWTDEQNRLNINMINVIIMIIFNMRSLSCTDFYISIKDNKELLNAA